MKNLLRFLILGLVLLVPWMTVSAQVTGSNMAGVVRDDSAKGMPGATIRAVHVPSGTKYGTATNADGSFTIQNMRVGGPYRVEVSYVGFEATTYDDIYLNLGETYQLNAKLSEEANELENVVVTGGRNPLLNNQRTGATTTVGVTQLNSLPSVSRNLTDFTRLSPNSGPSFSSNLNNSNTFAGRDGRYNNVQINGANFNNAFGLSSNLLPGGSAQPISLDAIEELQIGIAPFDVRQADFTGANVNAVTRSGTNTFTGSAYTFYRNQNFTGVHVGDNDLPPQATTTNNVYGVRFGGPIIKDKLFFFVNGESEKYVYPGVTWIANRPGVSGPNVSRASASALDSVAKRLEQLGYNPGAYENYGDNFTNKNTKFLARIDYNINDKHKLYVSYSQLNATEDNPVNATSAAGSTVSNNRIGSKALTFQNSNYGFKHTVYSATAELSSTFSPRLSNQLLVTYSNVRDQRTSPSSPFPFIDIVTGGSTSLRNDNVISAGYELFSYQNDLKNQNLNIVDNVTYNYGKHSFTGGLQYEYLTFGNSFLSYGTGYYRYASVSDFVNDRAPIVFGYSYPYADQGGNTYVKVNYGEGSAYLQDRVNLTKDFVLTAGIRFELPFYTYDLPANKYIDTMNLPDKDGNMTHYDVSKWPQSKVLVSPRVSFNWDALGNRTLQVRGGTGIFTGRVPFVWFTNQPGNSGTLTNQVVLDNRNKADSVLLSSMHFNADPSKVATENPSRFPQQGGSAVPGQIALVSPDLKMPQIWRSDLAVDMKLPFGLIGTAEAIYTKDLVNVYQRNANLPTAQTTMNDPNNTRPYWTNNRIFSNVSGVYVLENTNKGESFSFTIGAAKPMRKGIYGSLFYTATASKDVSSNPGSQPSSAWNGLPNTSSPNDLVLAPSQYLTPHRVVGNVSYRVEYAKHFATTVSLYYEGASLGRFSYMYGSDVNNDAVNADLIYVPKDANELQWTDITSNGKVVFTKQQQIDAFNAYMSQDKYLNDHNGGYAERYGARYPFYSRFDFKLLQDVFTDIGKGKRRGTLQLSMDMMNIGNFLNPHWGVQDALTVGSGNVSRILNATVNSTTHAATYQMATVLDNNGNTVLPTSTFKDYYNTASTWYMQLGLRFIF
jgi:hypothetical protein